MAKLSKDDLLKKMGHYVLENGLSTASLRPLANAAGTSDRMLIYHFGSKEALIGEVLQALSQDFAKHLEQGLPNAAYQSNRVLLTDIIGVLRSDLFAPYIRIWLDIVASASFDNTAYRDTGHNVILFFIAWIEQRLPIGTANPRATATLMLTLIEGTHAMDAVGQSSVADTAIEAAFPDET